MIPLRKVGPDTTEEAGGVKEPGPPNVREQFDFERLAFNVLAQTFFGQIYEH